MSDRLYNRVDKRELKRRLADEEIQRLTVSFYRYVHIRDPEAMRNKLYTQWDTLKIFGRIYLAQEGINAQMCVPESDWDNFVKQLYRHAEFADMAFKQGVDGDGKSFYKLVVKVRKKILGDGLSTDKYDFSKVGKHLTAEEFNEAMDSEGTIVVDMRNHYETEVGCFQGALLPDSDTFKEGLPKTLEMLEGKEQEKVLLYCTGGIRCEKASAYLKHHGFKDVNQLHGGIIEYAKQAREKGFKSRFIGKNFVFDERLGERITEDILSECHQCGETCDTHTNCANNDCHLLFIQCPECAERYTACCSPECQEISLLPIEDQRKLRKGETLKKNRNIYRSRLRPKLKDIIKEKRK